MTRICRTPVARLAAAMAMLALTLLIGAGCSRGDQAAATKPTLQNPAALPEGMLLASAPEDAVELAQAKHGAQQGDQVTVRGRIGGRRDPFVAGRAIFQLVDSSLPTCADKHGDGCPTPWDYCCESKEDITAKSATVQLTGEDGKPLAMSINGVSGIKPMATVVVRGTVAERPNETVMVINAEGLHVEP